MDVVEMVRGLYEYHRWANRRLFEVAVSLGEELAARDVGKQFSYPTVRRMFGHLYGADKIWLARWTGNTAASPVPGDEFTTLGSIRGPWDAVERDQRAFVESLTPSDLERTIELRNFEGQTTRVALWPVLQHVANHATHHRSEIATMMTMISGSPPDTGIATYLRSKAGGGLRAPPRSWTFLSPPQPSAQFRESRSLALRLDSVGGLGDSSRVPQLGQRTRPYVGGEMGNPSRVPHSGQFNSR